MATLADRCKQKILQDGIEEFVSEYTSIVAINRENDEMRISCVAHSDETPSCSMRLSDGVWHCFVPSCDSGGDLVSFYCYAKGITDGKEGVRRLAIDLGIIIDIPESLPLSHYKLLKSYPDALKSVSKTLGINEEIIDRFKIGLTQRHTKDSGEQYFITIPIKGPSGEYEDIRIYNKNLKPKIKSWATGSGKPKIFPFEVALHEDTLIIFGGEKDCLRAHSLGINNAITSTGSEGTLPAYYQEILSGKIIYICLDIDKSGKVGAAKLVNRLKNIAKKLYVIDLPPENLPENGDFSDWANLGNGKKEFEELMESMQPIHMVSEDLKASNVIELDVIDNKDLGKEDIPKTNKEPQEIDFKLIDSYKDHRNPVKFTAHTVGASASMKSYEAASKVEITCPRNQLMCLNCSINKAGEERMPVAVEINHNSELALELIKVTNKQKELTIKRLCGIPFNCKKCDIVEIERKPFQQMILTPPSSLGQMRETRSGSGADSGYKPAFFQGGQLPDNRDYHFTGYVQPDPKTQEAIVNIYNAKPVRNVIENFQIGNETSKAIDYFKLKENETIKTHFDKLHQIIENCTGIYGRQDIQQGVLEAIYSVIEIQCGDKYISNGWNEILIIGDTRCGKSVATSSIMEAIDVGEFISCENTSLAGLIGGIEYVDGTPIPVWGAFPRNNGGFLVLDEVDALIKKDGNNIIGQLSALRSSGKAEIQKIVQASTQARVRTVWLTNPNNSVKISSLGGGINAISDVITDRQDIARFTKVYSVREEDVSIETITNVRPIFIEEETRKLWNELAILTWSLKKDQICFDSSAQLYLKSEAKRLAEKYNDAIPLIEKGSVLDKIAKLSIPIAVLCGSFELNEDKIFLNVSRSHCEYAISHLCATYDSEAVGYSDYSIMENYKKNIVDPGEIRECFLRSTSMPRGTAKAMLIHLLTSPTTNLRYFEELVGLPMTAKSIWAALIKNHCLRPSNQAGSSQKTPAFINLIKEMLQELKEIEEKETRGEMVR